MSAGRRRSLTCISRAPLHSLGNAAIREKAHPRVWSAASRSGIRAVFGQKRGL